jgi:hypothetical protein
MNPLLYALPFLMLQCSADGSLPPPRIESAPVVIQETYTYDKIYTRCNVPLPSRFNPDTYVRPQASNTMFPSTILPCDSSDFIQVVYEGSSTYHNFTALFSNSAPIQIDVDASLSKEEAIYHALDYGKVIGQMPAILRLNVYLLTIKAGNGHPFSGEHTQTYIDLPLNFMNAKEENLIHDFAHASMNGRNGVIDEVAWKQAMEMDNFFPSIYAEYHHSGNRDPYIEDVPETITIYLAIRWREERFDPAVVEFYNQKMYHRFKILDKFNWDS